MFVLSSWMPTKPRVESNSVGLIDWMLVSIGNSDIELAGVKMTRYRSGKCINPNEISPPTHIINISVITVPLSTFPMKNTITVPRKLVFAY